MVKKCDRIIPGSSDCKCVAQKGNCIFQKNENGECAGKTGGIGADVKEGKKFALHNKNDAWVKNAVSRVLEIPKNKLEMIVHLPEMTTDPQQIRFL